MNRQKMIDSCTAPKIQGALIAAPLWIGTTLLFQNDRFTERAWMNAVIIVCIVACIGLLVWGRHLTKEKRNARRPDLSHRSDHPIGGITPRPHLP